MTRSTMQSTPSSRRARTPLLFSALAATALLSSSVCAATGGDDKKKPEYPPFAKVSEGFEKVVSTADGSKPLFDLWTRKKDGQMLAELRGFQGKKYFFAMTVAGGEDFAGLQAADRYVYFRRFDKRIALMQPMLDTVSKGDQQSKDSVERLFTDRLICDVPIVCMGPSGGPVIDMDAFLLGNARTFFSRSASGLRSNLAELKTAKAFPENVELAWQVPTSGGVLKTFHWSVSEIRGSQGYQPREADTRVGYFTTTYRDLGQYEGDESVMRFINRWHLEPAVPGLELSPPKKPIVFYIEHTTPLRYRRFVRDGLLYWNEAFEKIGIVNAIEVYYQDKATGAHMDKDPEDVRYNFIRWLNNDVATAIGPSRVNPTTGEILDADIILTDGWIRAFKSQQDVLPQIAMQGMSDDQLAWLNHHPRWDPRLILAEHHERQRMLAERAEEMKKPHAGHEFGGLETPELLGDEPFDGLIGRQSQVNGSCMASQGKSLDVAMLRMSLDLIRARKMAEKNGTPKEALIDGMPADFIGPLLADLVAHEVGHTLGLRHNFIASSLYDLDEINSDEVKGKKPLAASVMDYLPVNINMDDSRPQGDFAMIGVGPYDMWAIEYGYTPKKGDLPKILARCTEPALRYQTDDDTSGPNPLARRYDFAKNPLDYAKSQRELIDYHRPRLLTEFVDDGESWAKARQGYQLTLGLQMRSLSMMANWLGGADVRRLHKGDGVEKKDEKKAETKDEETSDVAEATADGDSSKVATEASAKPAQKQRMSAAEAAAVQAAAAAEWIAPIQPVAASAQREALAWVIENSFHDESFGLTPELLRFLTVDKWSDRWAGARFQSPAWPIHDRIMGIQSSVMTMVLNPGTLASIYDNEYRAADADDVLTVAEVLRTVKDAAWSELSTKPERTFTARAPMVSSLRRNLQREHIARLVELSLSGDEGGAASKVAASLARMQLRELKTALATFLENYGGQLDDYTRAHLEDCHTQTVKALDVQFTKDQGSGGGLPFFFFR